MKNKSLIKISPLEIMLGTILAGIIVSNPQYIEFGVAVYQSFYVK